MQSGTHCDLPRIGAYVFSLFQLDCLGCIEECEPRPPSTVSKSNAHITIFRL